MTGLWLGSYLVLWGVVVVLSILVVGCLQQIGLLQRQLGQPPANAESPIREVEHDGPQIGSRLPDLAVETVNGFGTLSGAATEPSNNGTLLVFMSPLCESCQYVVDPLNALVEDRSHNEQVIVILRADEQGCRAFLSVFPLRIPVICDSNREITRGFDVHASPFGLFYDASSTLVRKGRVVRAEDLRALLGDETVDQAARSHVFPPPGSLDMPVAAQA